MRERMTVERLMQRGLEGMALALRNTRSLHSEATVRELLTRAEGERRRDRPVYLAFARMAADVAGRLESGGAMDLKVRAQAEVGNALRTNGRFRESERVFVALETVAAEAGPAERAYAMALHGSLLRDMGQHARAVDRLCGAIRLYSEIDRPKEATRQSVTLACTLIDAGEYRQAQELLARAFRVLLEPPHDMFLLSACSINFVYLLVEAASETSETERAQLLGNAVFAAEVARRIAQGFSPRQHTLQLQWIYSRLLRIDGKLQAAGALLDELIQDFVDVGEPLFGAVAALDLAEIYLEWHDVDSLRQLGSACLTIFQAAELWPEFWQAFRLFHDGEDSAALRRLVRQTLARCGAPVGSAPRALAGPTIKAEARRASPWARHVSRSRSSRGWTDRKGRVDPGRSPRTSSSAARTPTHSHRVIWRVAKRMRGKRLWSAHPAACSRHKRKLPF